MAKMVYDEQYGDLTFALRTAIRKYNVSPSDYWTLQDALGEDNYTGILAAIKEHSEGGMFNAYRFSQAHYGGWR